MPTHVHPAARDLPSFSPRSVPAKRSASTEDRKTYALTLTSNDQLCKLTVLLASIRRHAEEAGLDDGFADNVEDGMRLQRMEQRTDPWA